MRKPSSPNIPGTTRFLEIRAKEPTWLSITAGGRRIFEGVLEANQTKAVEGVESARLRVGNAGGLEVFLHGKPVGSLGVEGQVKDVAFRGGKMEFIAPASANSAAETSGGSVVTATPPQ